MGFLDFCKEFNKFMGVDNRPNYQREQDGIRKVLEKEEESFKKIKFSTDNDDNDNDKE